MSEDIVTVLDRVDAYYSGAFSQLVMLTLAMLGFAGVFIPLLIQYYQGRVLQRDSKQFEEFSKLFIREEIDKLKADLLLQCKHLIDAQNETINLNSQAVNSRIDRAKAHIEARYWHSTAIPAEKSHGAGVSVLLFIRSGSSYIKARDESNLVITIRNIKDMLDKTTKVEIEADEAITREYKLFTAELKAFDKTGRYSPEIDELDAKLKTATTRS